MSVYKRRGSWFCDITIDGRGVQRVLKKARTRAQAIKAESVIQNKLFENKYKVEKRPEVRFDRFVKDHFLPYSELHKRTYPDDVLVCNMLFDTFGRMAISEIDPPMIEKFKQKRHEEARLFEKLEGQEWVQRIVTMAINTGMRQGEIFDLTWFDVDLMRGLLHVRVSKNGKDRFVPINQTIRTMLERLPRTSEYVFPSPKTEGRLVDVKFRFDKAKREAGIRDFRFHDLRHTAATRMADGGADAFALAEIFGWSDVRMALRYTHATDESKRRAVENLVKPIGPSDESVTNEKGRVAALP